jgi:anti-anti-sigma factor
MTVELIGLPLSLAHRSNEHHANLTRELAFIEAAGGLPSTSARLLTLSTRLLQKYSSMSETQQRRAIAVAAAGGSTVDLRYEVPAEVADEAEALFRLYQEVDEFCRTGDLVTLVMPPDVLAFRRWVSDQFCSQIRHDAPPAPWDQRREVTVDATPTAAPRPGRIVIAEDLDLGGAARMRNAVARQLELGVTDLEVDMAACEFVDSTGISMLLTTLARLRDRGGSLALVNASENVQRTLEYAGVKDLLDCR